MHELAVTESIIEQVAAAAGESRVVSLRLEIGKLSGVVADSIRFCFELVSDGTPLAEARLDIDELAGAGACATCGSTFPLEHRILLCPCGSADVHVVSGDELRIRSMEVI